MTKSLRQMIRDVAEEILRDARKPLHIGDLAPRIIARIGEQAPDQHTINNCLHDDRRFLRVARGTWTLRSREG